jgi:hypothetical protein
MAKEIVVTLANGDKAGETLKQLTHQAAALKKEISGLKPGTEDFVKSSASLNQVKDRMSDIDKQVKSTTQSSNGFKSALGSVLSHIPGFTQLSGALSSARGGVGGLTSGFGVLKGAIAATGLGLLLIVITGLVAWMSKLESVTNVLSGLWNGLTAGAEVLTKAIVNLDFEGLGKKMSGAAKEAYNLVQAFDELEDSQRELNLTNKATERDVTKLLLQSKNVSLSFKERIELLNQADDLESKQSKNRLAYAYKYLQTVNEEVELAKLKGELDDTLANKLNKAQTDFIQAEQDSINTQERIANRRENLNAAQEKAAEKRSQDAEKAKAKAAKEADEKAKADDLAIQGEIERADLLNAQELERAQKQEDGLNAVYEASRAKKAAEDQIAFDKQKALDDQAIQERIAKAEFEKQLGDFNLETQRLVTAELGDLIAQNIKDEQAAKVVKKSFALIDIGIRLSQELSANALSAAANPLNAVSFGAAGAAQLAASNARSLIFAAINTAKVLAFDKGGYTGDGGKYDPAGVVHKGEVVWSQADVAQFGGVRAVEAIRPTSRMNGYYNGGPVSPFKNNTGRAPIPSGNAGGSSPMGFDMDGLIDAIDKRIIRTVGTLKVQNVVTETQDAMKVVNTIRDEANV